ncbi:MAG: hypothetical protein ACK40G_00680 [Cytophagaceae bacterium]
MKKSILISFLILGLVFACKKNKDPKPNNSNNTGTNVSTSDPNAVSSSLTIKNAERLSGNPPAPTATVGSPKLATPTPEPIRATAGRITALKVEAEEGETKGVYIKVAGSNDYFKYTVPEAPRKSARTSKVLRAMTDQESVFVPITLPSNITTGTFCFQYCIFDSEGRISNIVNKCVEVVSLGGENAQFLTSSTWELYKYRFRNDAGEYEEEQSLGSHTYTNTAWVECPSDPMGYKEVEITETDNTTKSDFIFQNGGAGKYLYSFSNSHLDYMNSTCDNLVFKQDSYDWDLIFGWSYNELTKKIIVIFDFNEEEEGDPEALEMEVILQNNEMIWYDEVTDEYYHFRKK